MLHNNDNNNYYTLKNCIYSVALTVCVYIYTHHARMINARMITARIWLVRCAAESAVSCSPGSKTADPWRAGHVTGTRPSMRTQARLVGWGWRSAGTQDVQSI